MNCQYFIEYILQIYNDKDITQFVLDHCHGGLSPNQVANRLARELFGLNVLKEFIVGRSMLSSVNQGGLDAKKRERRLANKVNLIDG